MKTLWQNGEIAHHAHKSCLLQRRLKASICGKRLTSDLGLFSLGMTSIAVQGQRQGVIW